jgi:hypothetical protein
VLLRPGTTHLPARKSAAISAAWCEANGLDYICGLSGNPGLDRLVAPSADDVRVRRAETQAPMVRRFTETRYGAKSWNRHRRVAARIQATPKGLDIRYVVTNLHGGAAEWLYATLYCARGQAENQAAQGPTRVRPHQLPHPSGQSGPADLAHRRLLAAA